MAWAESVCSHRSSPAGLNDFSVFCPKTWWAAIQLPGGAQSVGYFISICWNNIDLGRRILSSRHLAGDSWGAERVLQRIKERGQSVLFVLLVFSSKSLTHSWHSHSHASSQVRLIQRCYDNNSSRAQQPVSNWYVGIASGWSHLH